MNTHHRNESEDKVVDITTIFDMFPNFNAIESYLSINGVVDFKKEYIEFCTIQRKDGRGITGIVRKRNPVSIAHNLTFSGECLMHIHERNQRKKNEITNT